jgi:hypothetical protein
MKTINPKIAVLVRIVIVAIPLFLSIILSSCQSNTQNQETSTEVSTAQDSKNYRFNLTECLGKDLIKPATFTASVESVDWLLDFNNGTSITYTIISGNEHDPMCGLKARDSLGDDCEICIKKTDGDNTTVTIDYSGKKLVYKGNYMR